MDQIESLLQRPKLYNNIDGVGEFGMGFMMLGFGLLTWLQVHSPESAIWHKVYMLFLWVGVMGAIIHYGSKAIKEHVTYRRTGFVEYKKRGSVLAAAIAFVAAAMVAAGLVFTARSHLSTGAHLGFTAPEALVGLVFAAAYGYGVVGLARWKWAVVGAISICSVAIAMFPAGWADAIVGNPSNTGPLSPENLSPGHAGAWTLSILTYGAILLISGGISFVLYLRHTQPPAQAAA